MPAGTLMLYWDYDTQWGTDADLRRGIVVPRDRGALEFECTERLLDLHAEFGIPSCFAVVGAAALPGERPYHDPAQVRRLHASGHEVASHGFAHEWVPGLAPAALRDMLSRSRDALEQCIGAPVSTFVPPYNQPFDHAPALSFSRSERRLAPVERTDVRGLCQALADTGYSSCRVAFRSLSRRMMDRVAGRLVDRPTRIRRISGIACVRLNTSGGFGPDVQHRLQQAAEDGGIVVAYGHPHSLHSGNSQDETFLVPFLREAARLRDAGQLRIALPRETEREAVA